MDVVKLALIVLGALVFLALFASLAAELGTWGTYGADYFTQMAGAPQSSSGARGSWSPLSIMTELIPAAFAGWDGRPLISPVLILSSVFGSIAVIAALVWLWRLLRGVMGL
ncbi:MAG: hypothetical protein Q8N51_17655 [Gammaproteobacteria bacterium]|nr:hypothetical protein [Gammaproteobacteria bacterium]